MTRKTSKSSTIRNAFYAQSGGVTAVINASACGVIETAMKYPRQIGKLYAGRHGIIGALTEDLIDVSKESRQTIRASQTYARRSVRFGPFQTQEPGTEPRRI